MKFKLSKGYVGNIVFQQSQMQKIIEIFNEKELKFFLYIAMLCNESSDVDINRIFEKFNYSKDEVFMFLDKYEKEKLLKISSSSITLISENSDSKLVKRFKNNLDSDIEMISEKELSLIIKTAERVFGKMLSVSEINTLTNLSSWYGLNADVIALLIEFVGICGKKSMNYVEKTALTWQDNDITSLEKANAYIREYEKKNSTYGKFKKLLKIYNRDLTKREKSFIDKWVCNFTESEIVEAYEKGIDATGKISFAYTDKILNSDNTVNADIKPRKKGSKFSNFKESNNKYDDIEDDIMKKMINQMKKEEK